MNIALDIRPALSRGTGVGTFVGELALALDALEGDHSIHLFTSSLKERWPSGYFKSLERSRVVDKQWPVSVLNALWHRFGWPRVDKFVGPVDISHSPTPLIMPSRAKRIVTVHDLYFMTHPDQTQREVRRDYTKLVKAHCCKADAVIAVSQATADDAGDLLEIPQDRLHVCWEDASPVFDIPPTKEELQDVESLISKPYFLFVGTIEPRKNLDALVRAFAILEQRHSDVKLVIAGNWGWGTHSFSRELEQLRDKEKVWISGYRQRRFIRALYHKAIALVMPSHCEGFGLPLVEAMACGCPLIVADNSALPEVAGEAALYWRDGEEELASLMERMATDSQLRATYVNRARERRKQFSWQETARRVLNLYRELV